MSENKEIGPEDCPRWDGCSAPLCPLDSGIALRLWYPEEEICSCQKYNKHRWIRKQRKWAKKCPKYIQRQEYATYDDLFKASRPRELTDEQRMALAERCKAMVNKQK